MTACSWAAPSPSRSPTTTRPVAIPTRTRNEVAGPASFGVLLMSLRVTEISQHAVTEILGNKAAGPGDYLGATTVIGADDVAQLLWIEPRRQCRGTDEVN